MVTLALQFRLIFAYTFSMFQGPTNRKQFVVTCKRCLRDIPTGVSEFPFRLIAVECCLCGEKRTYPPSEVFLGKPDHISRTRERRGMN